ncbi:hypothetical protein [Haematobacter genomosp. 1]|nr:hypothetical protein [Haematobacter genomosp. 1]
MLQRFPQVSRSHRRVAEFRDFFTALRAAEKVLKPHVYALEIGKPSL